MSDLGIYLPPAKRRQLGLTPGSGMGQGPGQTAADSVAVAGADSVPDPAPAPVPAPSAPYQRQRWEDLKRSVNGCVNRLNGTTIRPLIHSLFEGANLLRGRGLLARTILRAAVASPLYSDGYAALVSVVNAKLPEIGELVLHRAVLQFRLYYKRRDKGGAVATAAFLGHLFNQRVAHELLCLQILTVLLDGDPTDDSVEVALEYVKVVGRALGEVSPAGVRAVMERLRSLLHDGTVGRRVQYQIEVALRERRDGFKSYPPPVAPELDLVEDDDQITHETGLDDEGLKKQEILDVFRYDEGWEDNERAWARIRAEILGEGSDDDDDGSSGGEGGHRYRQRGGERRRRRGRGRSPGWTARASVRRRRRRETDDDCPGSLRDRPHPSPPHHLPHHHVLRDLRGVHPQAHQTRNTPRKGV